MLINNGDPADPNNNVTLYALLVEPPSLSPPSPVNVTAAQPVTLSNAAEPPGGARASVEVTGTSVSGPFTVSGFPNGTFIKNGESEARTTSIDMVGFQAPMAAPSPRPSR